MAYNTVPIKKDVDNKPIPQYYNPLVDQYEALQGRNGANRVELYDADGNPVDLVGLIETIINILNQNNLPIGASTESKQDEIISNLVDILTKLQDGIKQDGNTMEYYGKSTDTKPTDIKVGATFFEIDTKTVYMWDGANWVVM